MPQTIEQMNGHDTGHNTGEVSTPDTGQGRRKRRLADVPVMVQPKTHELIRDVAQRLGRTNDAVIRRAMHLLNKETADQKAQTNDDWADEVAS